jgi:branched-chain amino acid transport system permease protein
LIFFALRFLLANYGAWYRITLGTIAIIVMLKAPRGLWGLIGDGFNLHLFPVQRYVRLNHERANQSGPSVSQARKLQMSSEEGAK